VNLTPSTAVTAAAIEHALAGALYGARIKGVFTRHPLPACPDAAVVRWPFQEAASTVRLILQAL
jgi:hypothetical protein